MPAWKIDLRDTDRLRRTRQTSAVPLKWAHDAKTGEPRYIHDPEIRSVQASSNLGER